MQIRHLVFGALVLLFAAQAGYYYPILPEVIASHFDGAGEPNGWMSKPVFFLLEFVFLGFIVAEMWLLPRLVEKLPDRWLNLPNKDYWLVAERRASAFETFRVYFQWFSVGLLVLFVCVNQMVFTANLTRQPLDSMIWAVLAAYLIFVVAWMIKFILAFKKPL